MPAVLEVMMSYAMRDLAVKMERGSDDFPRLDGAEIIVQGSREWQLCIDALKIAATIGASPSSSRPATE
jgi:electron transfer flavoprotein alpha subunit